MSPRFERMVDVSDFTEHTDALTSTRRPQDTARTSPARKRRTPNLLTQETVLMTVLAQDPLVEAADREPVTARIPVPAERLQRGPRGHRFHVVDVEVGTGRAWPPVELHAGDPWVYRDPWQDADPSTLSEDRRFRAQNVYAVAAHTLALVEQHLGRPIPWHSGQPQLFLIPQARVEANAFYSRPLGAVLFGWQPALGGRRALHTALSYDVITHEVTHAVLDGLRPRFAEPGLPDQLAFHEALADLVALLSVFTLEGVAEALLRPTDGRVGLGRTAAERTTTLVRTPLARLAEQVGSRRGPRRPPAGEDNDVPALRWSALLQAGTAWQEDPAFCEPHRRSEVLVAAFMQTLVAIWVGRLEPLGADGEGRLDAARVAEEGVKSARHLLGMLLRALDYLPPVDLEFADVLDAVLTADRRLAPDDDHGYRDTLENTFDEFGIQPPRHHIVDEDGVAAPRERDATRLAEPELAGYPPDPDRGDFGIRYEHLNMAALRTSPEEVFQFLWNNSRALRIDVRFPTRVDRVLTSTRVGPDGLVLTEILADYTQTLRTRVRSLPPDISAPAGMPKDDVVELCGAGVLVFDQFGRFRLHQRQPLLDVRRQEGRLRHLYERGLRGADGVWGGAGGADDARLFALLHRAAPEPEE
jgi:hypothetical protein